MKKVRDIFKEYYLVYTLFCVVLFVISYFTTENQNNKLFYSFLFSLFFWLLMLIPGTIELLKYEYFRPKKIDRLINMVPFSELKKRSFRRHGNKLVGQIKKYHILAEIEWESYQKKPIFCFRVLYKSNSLNRLMTFNEFRNYNDILDRDGIYINLNSIEKSYSKRELLKCHYRDILREIDKMIIFLKLKELTAVSYIQWQSDFQDFERIEEEYLRRYV